MSVVCHAEVYIIVVGMLEIFLPNVPFLCCGIKKVEPTHGTPPATGIASFRSTTTKYNIPSKTKAVKWIFSGIDSLCVFICSYSVMRK